ncbi:MAG: hypothetical protein K0U47_06190 [Epsilonproteobacteria bacterium]|nr:hypothetical protein [Campylobacterota bacterium]
MNDIIMNLISDMKICLAIALLTGLIFGYLYTKLRARETYKPQIKKLNNQIQEVKIESDEITMQNSEIESAIAACDDELNQGNLTITKYKNEISDLESNRNSLEQEDTGLKNQHQKQESILHDYSNEIKTLQSSLELKDINQIEDHKVTFKAAAIDTADHYRQKCDSYEGLCNEEEVLKKEIFSLNSNVASLTASLNKKKLELSDATENIGSLKNRLQDEYDAIVANLEENKTLIQSYKKQLLAIKEKLA